MAKAFAVALRNRRKARGVTQEALAEKADVAAKMVSLIERNQRNPSLNVADSLAQALGTTLSQLLAEAERIRRENR